MNVQCRGSRIAVRQTDNGGLLAVSALFALTGVSSLIVAPADQIPLGGVATLLLALAIGIAGRRPRIVYQAPTPTAAGDLNLQAIAVDWDPHIDGWLQIRGATGSQPRTLFDSGDVRRALSVAGSLAKALGVPFFVGGHATRRLRLDVASATPDRRTVPPPPALRRATFAMAAVTILTTAQLLNVLLSQLSTLAQTHWMSYALLVGAPALLTLITCALLTQHTRVELRSEVVVEKRSLGLCWQRRRFASGSQWCSMITPNAEWGLVWLSNGERSVVVATTAQATSEFDHWLSTSTADETLPLSPKRQGASSDR